MEPYKRNDHSIQKENVKPSRLSWSSPTPVLGVPVPVHQDLKAPTPQDPYSRQHENKSYVQYVSPSAELKEVSLEEKYGQIMNRTNQSSRSIRSNGMLGRSQQQSHIFRQITAPSSTPRSALTESVLQHYDLSDTSSEEDDAPEDIGISERSSKSHLFGECLSVESYRQRQEHSSKASKSEGSCSPSFIDVEDLEEVSLSQHISEIGGPPKEFGPPAVIGQTLYCDGTPVGPTVTRRTNKHAWLERTKDQIVRVGKQYFPSIRTATVTAPRPPRVSELDHLREVHRNKVDSLSSIYQEDYFDFCLVLVPQEVYSFWAERLDFRLEQLGKDVAQSVQHEYLHPQTSFPDTDETVSSSNSLNSDSTEEQGSPAGVIQDYSTPQTGIHRRRGKRDYNTPYTTMRQHNTSEIFTPAQDKTIQPRLSIFDRAINALSPNKVPGAENCPQAAKTPDHLNHNTHSISATTNSARRRWGNRPLAKNMLSPPVRSLNQTTLPQTNSVKKKPSGQHLVRVHTTGSRDSTDREEKKGDDSQRNNPKGTIHTLREEDIPMQVIPRGIAARRKEGIVQFLSALKRGVVLRRHRINMEAAFCKIFSTDGGDTIQYQNISYDEAMKAFREQRIYYNNPKHARNNVVKNSQSWSYEEDVDGQGISQNCSVPDFIAAQKYREKMIRKKSLPNKVANIATQITQRGSVRAADIVAVHPARHEDPRSTQGQLGTTALRRSKSEYSIPHSFTLVMRAGQKLRTNSVNIDTLENKWYTGEGTEVQFTYINFEAATEAEYWLIFRGFLLLHRDAAAGRFALQRASGIGSHFNRLELEQRKQDCDSGEHNTLHKDEFNEPLTVGCLERLIVDLRKMDTTYMEGFARPGAIPPPSDYFLGFRFAGTQIWSRLRQAGLETQRVYGLDTRQVMIKVRCPSDRLMDVAEALRLKLKTKEGFYAPFREDMMEFFESVDDKLESQPVDGKAASLFRSSHRQQIIDFIIGSMIRDSGAELSQTTDLGKMISIKAPLHMHPKLDAIYSVWISFWKYEHWVERDGCSLSHESTEQKRQRAPSPTRTTKYPGRSAERKVPGLFYRFFVGCFYQPLDSVEEYFGEKVAFYFAWLQHCSAYLVVLAVAGLIVFICQVSSGNWDHPIRPFFSVFLMLWSFLVLVNWKKRSNFLAYRWGTIDYREQETTRPQFKGDYVRDELTNEWVVTYPKWKRWLKYLISIPLSIAFTIGIFLLILMVHSNRDLLLSSYFEKKTNPDSEPFEFKFSLWAINERRPVTEIELSRELLMDSTFWILAAGFPSMLGLFLPLMNFILMNVSIVLNNFENYRTESEYRSFLIIKVFAFRFVCYFATLYYYAFVSVGSRQAIENGYLRIGMGVMIFITVAHWWNIFLHVILPILIRRLRMRFRRKKLKFELSKIEAEEESISKIPVTDMNDELKKRKIELVNKRLLLDQAQDDVWLEIMRPPHDSFPEYIQTVVQFAYISCFSVVLPITPFVCLINHLLSMRLDAFKLCRGRRRPLREKTGGIGVWEHLLHIVVVISVLTNCWLMGFTNSQFSWLETQIGTIGLFGIVVGWEHLMLLIKYVMQSAISRLPTCVRESMRREQHRLARQRAMTMRVRKDGRPERKSILPMQSELPDYARISAVFSEDESAFTYGDGHE